MLELVPSSPQATECQLTAAERAESRPMVFLRRKALLLRGQAGGLGASPKLLLPSPGTHSHPIGPHDFRRFHEVWRGKGVLPASRLIGCQIPGVVKKGPDTGTGRHWPASPRFPPIIFSMIHKFLYNLHYALFFIIILHISYSFLIKFILLFPNYCDLLFLIFPC